MWVQCLQIVATCLDIKPRRAAGVRTWRVWPLNGSVVLQLVKENTRIQQRKRKNNPDVVELCYQVLNIFPLAHWLHLLLLNQPSYQCLIVLKKHPQFNMNLFLNVWGDFFFSVPVQTLFWCLNCPSRACWSIVQLLWDFMVTSRIQFPPVQKPHSQASCPVSHDAVFDRGSLKCPC